MIFIDIILISHLMYIDVVDIHWYSFLLLLFIDIHWYSLIFIDVHWYLLIFILIVVLLLISLHWYHCIWCHRCHRYHQWCWWCHRCLCYCCWYYYSDTIDIIDIVNYCYHYLCIIITNNNLYSQLSQHLLLFFWTQYHQILMYPKQLMLYQLVYLSINYFIIEYY